MNTSQAAVFVDVISPIWRVLGCDRPAYGSKLALRNACPGFEIVGSQATKDVRSGSPAFLRKLAFHGCQCALENREV